ncbi:DNA polymerase [Motilibacter peucedani]|uniref:Type-4 uracil-DNA glycosylase n=1 Tax=Motilibacter peucedani TaxID=598650 RepID=A0A420XKX1_9ACTN|nr:uracil-DNA glycosylase [Motilibacter peucedani]RKS69301.1 DNA polymerase [Motilibacter peucedani]
MSLPLLEAPRQRTWDELSEAARGCTACAELAETRTQVVPGEAPPGAELLLVGEAPGAQEDESGRPFVGKAGQLLTALLGEAGIARESVAVANVLKCRPPKNRKPRRAEVGNCRPWLARQIELVDPLLVVTLGGTAAEWVVGPGARIASLRQADVEYAGRRVLCTYHPSAAVRFGPAGEPMAALRADLARAAACLDELRRPA